MASRGELRQGISHRPGGVDASADDVIALARKEARPDSCSAAVPFAGAINAAMAGTIVTATNVSAIEDGRASFFRSARARIKCTVTVIRNASGGVDLSYRRGGRPAKAGTPSAMRWNG
jgi:hypothetical protein